MTLNVLISSLMTELVRVIIKFKLAVTVYQALHRTALQYLSDRSSASNKLTVRPSHLVTVGERSFASAGSKLWNSLPDDITSAISLTVL